MKLHEFLHWIFAGLFVVIGVMMLVLGKDENSRQWAGTAALCLGGFSLSLMWNAWVTGVINLRDFHYRRASEPKRFYATLLMLLVTGIVVVVTSVLAMLDRL